MLSYILKYIATKCKIYFTLSIFNTIIYKLLDFDIVLLSKTMHENDAILSFQKFIEAN